MPVNKVHVESELERPQGGKAVIGINLRNGRPRALLFWDIDKTLVDLESIYKLIRSAIWPEAVAHDGLAEVSRVHLAGFRLGTMWRELYRLYAIYELGRTDWKDIKLYEYEFLAPGRPGEKIDESGDGYHELADKLLEKFDRVAENVIISEYERDPAIFIKTRIKPTWDLLQSYYYQGVPMVGLSANPRGFIRAVCKYCGLADYLIDCASDTDVPGRKEYKMRFLIKNLQTNGLAIPYENLLIIGDSLVGDIGSGSRFVELMRKEKPEICVRVKGILVVEDESAQKQAESIINNTLELQGWVGFCRLDKS